MASLFPIILSRGAQQFGVEKCRPHWYDVLHVWYGRLIPTWRLFWQQWLTLYNFQHPPSFLLWDSRREETSNGWWTAWIAELKVESVYCERSISQATVAHKTSWVVSSCRMEDPIFPSCYNILCLQAITQCSPPQSTFKLVAAGGMIVMHISPPSSSPSFL